MSDEPTPRLDALDADREDAPVFRAPWQARAFVVAVALSDAGTYEWSTFQARLAVEIERDDGSAVPEDGEIAEETYYRQWIGALERLLLADGVLDEAELEERVREFADGERDASEWVAGEHDHSHDSTHSRSHTHSRDSTHDREHDHSH
jgi:nitrile hydratase accessory protein